MGTTHVSLQLDCSNTKHFFRLAKLLIVEGTRAVRAAVENHLPLGSSLITALMDNRGKIKTLKQKGLINKTQFTAMFPTANKDIDLTGFDINVWVILARNVTTSNLPSNKWNTTCLEKLDNEQLVSWEYDVIRIRLIRNLLFHMTALDMDDIQFQRLWREASGAIRRLCEEVTDDVIEQCRHLDVVSNMDELERFVMDIKRQCLEDKVSSLSNELIHTRRLSYLWTSLILLLVVALALSIPLILIYGRSPDNSCQSQVKHVRAGVVGELKMLDRKGWKAAPPIGRIAKLVVPVHYVIIGHTAFDDVCSNTDICCQEVWSMQYLQVNSDHKRDITYHYMIDSNGVVYEGRANYSQTNTSTTWDSKIIFISLFGNFMYTTPTYQAVGALHTLLRYLVEEYLIVEQYILYPLCDIRDTLSPGKHLYDVLYQDEFAPHNPPFNDSISFCNFTYIH